MTLDETEFAVTARVARWRAGERPIIIHRVLPGAYPKAKDASAMQVAARGAFEKLGHTRLILREFKFDNPEGRFVPVSQINMLRRGISEAFEQELDEALGARLDQVRADVLPPKRQTVNGSSVAWSVKVDRIGFLDEFGDSDFDGIDEVVVDIARDHAAILTEKLERLAGRLGRDHIRLAIPPITRKWEERGIALKLAGLREAGFSKWEAANVSAWSFLNAQGLLNGAGRQDAGAPKLSADWSVYVVNRMAARQVMAMGAERFALSPEDGLENMRSLLAEFGAKAVVIVHQDTPMFMAESCAYANLIGGCPSKANCSFESMDMVSSYGEKVQAVDYHCRTIVLNKGAFCLAQRLPELRAAGATSLRADFIYRNYLPAEAVKVWRTLRSGKNVPGGHAANFDRGML